MKKWFEYILPVLFFTFIGFSFLNQIFNWKKFVTHDENRVLAKMPQLDINRLDYFPGQFDNYLNDNFTLRAPFLKLFHNTKYFLVVSPNEKDVIIGNDGQLFLGTEQWVFYGMFNFTKERLDTMQTIWDARSSYFAKKKIPFYWEVIPSKYNIYKDDLPYTIRAKEAPNRATTFQKWFNNRYDNRMVYPLDLLLKHRSGAYYFYDNHWTEKGAFYGYRALMKRMQQDFPEMTYLDSSDIQWRQVNFSNGNLLKFIGQIGNLTERELRVKDFPNIDNEPFKGIKPIKGFPYPWEYIHHFINHEPLVKKKVLIIRDSFGSNAIPFFAKNFSETLFVWDSWRYGLNEQIIDKFQPDIVIYLTSEVTFDNMLKFPPIIKSE